MDRLKKFRRCFFVLFLFLLGGWAFAAHAEGPVGGEISDKKPNIIFILTDDLSMNLLPYMPNVLAMEKEGTSFANYFVTDSLCCPSRSSIFTGKLPHNTRVFTNTPPDGGYGAFIEGGNEPVTFAVALQRAGYQTAMLGKYLNGYYPRQNVQGGGKNVRNMRRQNGTFYGRNNAIPVGWNEWDVGGNAYSEFNYVLNQNGRIVQYGGEPKDYLTDVLSGLADAFIRKSPPGPFFIEIATFAPHAPYTPAPRDAKKFPGLTAPHTAAFGARPDSDAPHWLKGIPPLRPIDIQKIDHDFRMRAQSVQAVDQMIGQIRTTLAALNDHNTYIFFSSDNGLHMGEYSLRPGKMTPFEMDIHVPLVIIGPGVPKGRLVNSIVENIDLCPTFTELAGASSPTSPDGHSLVPLLHGIKVEDWRHLALIEHRRPARFRSDPDAPMANAANPPTYEALRSDDALYVEYQDGEISYYDLNRDPEELKNIAASMPPENRKELHDVLRANQECKGAEACWNAQRLTLLATQPADNRQPPVGAAAPGIKDVSPGRMADVAGSSHQKTRVKIMPLGDSITFGSPDRSYGGYEHLLATLLTNDGYLVDFVGSQRGGNEGHPGWTIPQIKSAMNSNGWLTTYQPDIILLHVGSNDLRQGGAASAPDNLSALLDDILARLPETHIIVAQIIPFRRGPDPEHRSFNAAIAGIVAGKGPRVSMVDMQNILSSSDYADGIHPNPDGYDKMARVWESAIRTLFSASSQQVGSLASPSTSAGEDGKTAALPASQGTATAPVIHYASGSTTKLAQLVGDEDKERHQPTLSRTFTRYQVQGTDLGYSFEHEGRTYFLFGDTVGRLDRALDTIATTDARDPEHGVRLDFLTFNGDYLTVQPPGIPMGPFEVPVSGISLGGRMYVVVSTDHSMDRNTDRSVLTKFIPPATFTPIRTISQLPAGRFIKMSMHAEPGPMPGLPPGGPFVLLWGTGVYRKSDAYLSIVPVEHFETGEGTRYFAGLDATGVPTWSEKESDAKPVVQNGTMGDLSVTWCKDLGLWLMTYDSRPPAIQGIMFSYSRAPWGPWSEPQVIFNAIRDGALGKFIHDPRSDPDDGLAGPVIGKGRANPAAVRGGAYAPYVVERFTQVKGSELNLYYVLSTWNPYVVVLMKSRLKVG